MFDPFFTTKDVGEGTGLGLSICHGIISGLGGQISIEQRARATGTLVRVVLPAARRGAGRRPDRRRAPARRAACGPRRHRVLLVDDEPQVAHTMERLLRRDYDVTVALCGQDALEHITRGARFDAIVSDVMMPNMTGIELLEELQRDRARSGAAADLPVRRRVHRADPRAARRSSARRSSRSRSPPRSCAPACCGSRVTPARPSL